MDWHFSGTGCVVKKPLSLGIIQGHGPEKRMTFRKDGRSNRLGAYPRAVQKAPDGVGDEVVDLFGSDDAGGD
jgi:hypothetical protein